MLNGEASLGSKGVLSSKRLLRAKRDSLGNDDGIGIAEESLSYMFGRFYRMGISRGSHQSGAVLDWHSAKVFAGRAQ